MVEHKKTIFMVAGIAVIVCSFFQYLYNALNDYGLLTNSLNKFIAAQADQTSDHDYGSGSCNGVTIFCGYYLKRYTTKQQVKSDAYGTVSYEGQTISGLERNTYYWVSVVKSICEHSPSQQNICHKDDQQTTIVCVGKATSDETSGDGTSGDGSNGR